MRPDAGSTRQLLRCGVAAGAVYVLVGAAQILTRSGFDPRRHALSLMSNGDLGWIQIANFLLSGVLVLLGAIGVRRVLHPGRAGTWGALLLGLYGVGLIGAGIFVADPMDGFPIGTPAGPPVVMTQHGVRHFMAGGIGFLGLIGASLVFARRFMGTGEHGWALWSAATGLGFCAAFAWIGSGSKHPAVIPVFTAAVVLSWLWLSALCLRLSRVM